MTPDGYTFTIDGTEIPVQLSELVIVAAFRNAKPPPYVLGCRACVTLCIEKLRACGCCSHAPSDSHFNMGQKASANPGSHRVIPKAQLDEALALVRAA
jgi:hypothetical protein